MNKEKRYQILSRLREHNPNPTTELEYETPFQLLIAVLLSAQATDVGVNKATRKLFPVAPTAEKMLALGVDGIKEHIKTIGLFNSNVHFVRIFEYINKFNFIFFRLLNAFINSFCSDTSCRKVYDSS